MTPKKLTPANLKALLKRKKMSQFTFAWEAGFSEAFLSRYLGGHVYIARTPTEKEPAPHTRLRRHFVALEAE